LSFPFALPNGGSPSFFFFFLRVFFLGAAFSRLVVTKRRRFEIGSSSSLPRRAVEEWTLEALAALTTVRSRAIVLVSIILILIKLEIVVDVDEKGVDLCDMKIYALNL